MHLANTYWLTLCLRHIVKCEKCKWSKWYQITIKQCTINRKPKKKEGKNTYFSKYTFEKGTLFGMSAFLNLTCRS